MALQFFYRSDHRPVLTSLDLDPPRKTWKPERNWKTLDSNLARVECEKLQLLSHFQDKDEVDKYLEYLDNFLQEVVSKCTQLCCGLYCAVLTECRIKGKMWKVGWFLQKRSVKECEGVWWNIVVVTPDQ